FLLFTSVYLRLVDARVSRSVPPAEFVSVISETDHEELLGCFRVSDTGCTADFIERRHINGEFATDIETSILNQMDLCRFHSVKLVRRIICWQGSADVLMNQDPLDMARSVAIVNDAHVSVQFANVRGGWRLGTTDGDAGQSVSYAGRVVGQVDISAFDVDRMVTHLSINPNLQEREEGDGKRDPNDRVEKFVNKLRRFALSLIGGNVGAIGRPTERRTGHGATRLALCLGGGCR